MSKDMDEKLKLAHKLMDVVNQAKRNICVTLLWYNVEKPEGAYAQLRLIVQKEEEKKFQEDVY